MRRLLLTPRWWLLHGVALLLVVTFLRLGWWQLSRAEEGNTLSIGYALEWPCFAAFVVLIWGHLVRDELRGRGLGSLPDDDPADPSVPVEQSAAVEPEPPAPSAAVPAADEDDEDDELAAYNRYLGRLNAARPRSQQRGHRPP